MRFVKPLYLALIIVLFLPMNCFTAEEDSSEYVVNSSFNIVFKSATDLEINVDMDVIQATAFGETYDRYSVQALMASNDENDIEARGVIKSYLHSYLKKQIESSFENATVTSEYEKPEYKNKMFHEKYNVELTSEFFKINTSINAHDFINGLLDLGAQLNYTFYLKAEKGWRNKYEFKKPSSIQWIYANEQVEADRIEWEVDNREGLNPEVKARLNVQKHNPTTYPQKEEILLEFILDTRNTRQNSLKINVLAKNIDIKNYVTLPGFITNVRYVPSDGIRLLINNNVTSWKEFYNSSIKKVIEKTAETLQNSSFNQTLNLLFKWDINTTSECTEPYNVSKMDNQPPIRAMFTDDDIQLKICGLNSRVFFGFVNNGAAVNITPGDINFGENLDKIGYIYNVTLYLPDFIKLNDNNVCRWVKKEELTGQFKSDIAKKYFKENISTVFEIDFNGGDFNFFGFITGETGLNFDVSSDCNKNYLVIKLPQEFKTPEKIRLSYIDADVLRLCIEENVFTKKDVEDFLNRENKLFENIISDMFNGKIESHVNKKGFENSVKKWDGKIDNMVVEKPVTVNCYAHCRVPAEYSYSLIPPDFSFSELSFKFMGLQNQNVTYKMYFPSGVDVNIVEQTIEKAEVKQGSDGRKYIEINFNVSEANQIDEITCEISSSPLFILSLLTPCMFSLGVTVILALVIYVLKKKRGRRGLKTHRKTKQDTEGYQDKEYYIPPPPPSSRE